MIKFEKYKPSEIDWLGEIPQHWTVDRLKNIFSFGTGLSITKKNLEDKGIPCVNYGEIHSKFGFEIKPEVHSLKCVPESYLDTSRKSLLKKGDFIFADTSEDIEGSGNFTYLNSEIQVFAGYHTIAAKPKQQLIHRYIAYLLDSASYRNQFRSNVVGIKVYSITQGLLNRLKIYLPTIEEQDLNCKYLDTKILAIDKKINILIKKANYYREYRKSIINELVCKGLNKNIEFKDSGIDWIGQIPEHWGVIRLKDIFNFSKGINSSKYNQEYVNDTKNSGKYPVFSGQTANSGVMAKINSFDYNFDKDIILVTTVGAKAMEAKLIRGKFSLSQNCAMMKLQNKNFDIQFIFHFVTQLFYEERKIIPTIMQPSLRIDDLNKFIALFPPLKEQTEIGKYLNIKTKAIDEIVENINTQIITLKELRKTLINDVVTGKIKVTKD